MSTIIHQFGKIHIKPYDILRQKGEPYRSRPKLVLHNEKLILSFGDPINYYLDDLYKYNYPFDADFCIHLGRKLVISKKQINKLLTRCIHYYKKVHKQKPYITKLDEHNIKKTKEILQEKQKYNYYKWKREEESFNSANKFKKERERRRMEIEALKKLKEGKL